MNSEKARPNVLDFFTRGGEKLLPHTRPTDPSGSGQAKLMTPLAAAGRLFAPITGRLFSRIKFKPDLRSKVLGPKTASIIKIAAIAIAIGAAIVVLFSRPFTDSSAPRADIPWTPIIWFGAVAAAFYGTLSIYARYFIILEPPRLPTTKDSLSSRIGRRRHFFYGLLHPLYRTEVDGLRLISEGKSPRDQYAGIKLIIARGKDPKLLNLTLRLLKKNIEEAALQSGPNLTECRHLASALCNRLDSNRPPLCPKVTSRIITYSAVSSLNHILVCVNESIARDATARVKLLQKKVEDASYDEAAAQTIANLGQRIDIGCQVISDTGLWIRARLSEETTQLSKGTLPSILEETLLYKIIPTILAFRDASRPSESSSVIPIETTYRDLSHAIAATMFGQYMKVGGVRGFRRFELVIASAGSMVRCISQWLNPSEYIPSLFDDYRSHMEAPLSRYGVTDRELEEAGIRLGDRVREIVKYADIKYKEDDTMWAAVATGISGLLNKLASPGQVRFDSVERNLRNVNTAVRGRSL